MARKALDRDAAASLRQLFLDKACVVTGTADNVDWHHLDEDSRNTVPGNLVPVARDLNLTLEAYRRFAHRTPTVHARDELLTPAYLEIMAARWFRLGFAGRAYGASRLATWLSIRYAPLFPEADAPVASLCESMRTLRHAGRLDLLDDVLRRDASWIVDRGGLSNAQKVALLLEFASIFQDVLRLGTSAQLLTAAQETLNTDPRLAAHLDARVIRRKAIARILANENYAAIADDLARADSLDLDSGLWVSVQNVNAWLELARGRESRSAERLDEIVPTLLAPDGLPRKLVVAPWEAVESMLTAASVQAVGGSARRLADSLTHLDRMNRDATLGRLRIRPVAAHLALGTQGKSIAEVAEMSERFIDRSLLRASTAGLVEELAAHLLQR
jgi:hypothetical protein